MTLTPPLEEIRKEFLRAEQSLRAAHLLLQQLLLQDALSRSYYAILHAARATLLLLPAKTHTANENFNPDLFLRVRGTHDILVVEVKAEGDDSNRNRAKCRDGLRHFDVLNDRLVKMKEPWRYHFYFLSSEDYTHFFEKVRDGKYAGWKSGLMQELTA